MESLLCFCHCKRANKPKFAVRVFPTSFVIARHSSDFQNSFATSNILSQIRLVVLILVIKSAPTHMAVTHQFPAPASWNDSWRYPSTEFYRVDQLCRGSTPRLVGRSVLVSHYPNTMGAYTSYEDWMFVRSTAWQVQEIAFRLMVIA